jgi:tyrosinase
LVDAVNQRYANASSVLSLITKSKNVYDFQMTMQGVPGSGDVSINFSSTTLTHRHR